MSSRIANPHSCGGCDARWASTHFAHCAACHCTFTGVTAFDVHRNWGVCHEPRSVGLRLRDQVGIPIWGATMDEAGRERMRMLREAAGD